MPPPYLFLVGGYSIIDISDTDGYVHSTWGVHNLSLSSMHSSLIVSCVSCEGGIFWFSSIVGVVLVVYLVSFYLTSGSTLTHVLVFLRPSCILDIYSFDFCLERIYVAVCWLPAT